MKIKGSATNDAPETSNSYPRTEELSTITPVTNKNKSEEEFVTVVRKKSKKRKVEVITGTAQIEETANFSASLKTKKAWIYVGNVKKSATSDDVQNYIVNRHQDEDINISVEKLSCKGQNQSFCIGIKFELKERLMDATFWPKGVVVRRFNFNFKNSRGFQLTPQVVQVT